MTSIGFCTQGWRRKLVQTRTRSRSKTLTGLEPDGNPPCEGQKCPPELSLATCLAQAFVNERLGLAQIDAKLIVNRDDPGNGANLVGKLQSIVFRRNRAPKSGNSSIYCDVDISINVSRIAA